MNRLSLLLLLCVSAYAAQAPPVFDAKTRNIPSNNPFAVDYGVETPGDYAGRLVLELNLVADAGCQILSGRVQNPNPNGWHGGHEYFTATIPRTYRGQHLGFFLGRYTCSGNGNTIPRWNGKAKALVCGNYDYCPSSALVPRPGYVPTVNGCGSDTFQVPDLWFRDSCNEHDTGYGTCLRAKSLTDDEFLVNMVNDCYNAFPNSVDGRSRCTNFALTYAAAVAIVGDNAYNDAQRAACVCCQ